MNDVAIVQKVISMLTELLAHEAAEGEGTPEQLGQVGNGVKKSVSAAERKKDAHMGPGESFPVGPAGQHLRDAWDLAGHAADPAEVRANILRFAHEHGLTSHLPEAARQHMMRKSLTMEDLMFQWFGPVVVEKAFNPINKPGVILKAWESPAGLNIEGWVSTNDQDMEKDITEPEAFSPSLADYFRMSAPISYNHQTNADPAGHLQKGALVRDGKIFLEASHPFDPAEFEHFPGTGTGFYGRGILTDPSTADKVRKGNVGGFSFIGNAKRYEKLPGGGKRYREIYPLMETTVAPYPVNTKAAILVAKAYGLEEM